jgi:periplasmic divalent cation tolerance protein
MIDACTIFTTAGSETEAEDIAGALLSEQLAACVQMTPITSRYVWKGELAREQEVLLLIKTRAELFERVRARIRALHSYETPEVLMAPVTAGDADYLAWLAESTAGR